MKYVFVDHDLKVREIIPEFVKAFPGMSADRRYSPDFLKHCLPVSDEVEVEHGMEYHPLENRFVRPVRFTGSATVTAVPGKEIAIPVSFSAEGEWELADDGGLILDRTEEGLYSPPLDEGRYAVTVRLEADHQTVEQTIAIVVTQPMEPPAEEPEAAPEADIDPDRMAALEARVEVLEDLLSSILNFRKGVTADGS